MPPDWKFPESRTGADYLSSALRGALLLVVGIVTLSAQAAAQEDMASNVCSSAEYNLFIGLLIVVVGASLAIIVTAGFSGAAAKALGGLSQTLSKKGSAGMVYSVVAVIFLGIILVIMGVAFSNISVPVPSECFIPV